VRASQEADIGFEVSGEGGELRRVSVELARDGDIVHHEEYRDPGMELRSEKSFDLERASGEYSWRVTAEYPEGAVSAEESFTALETLPELAELEDGNRENYFQLLQELEPYGITEQDVEDLFIGPESGSWNLLFQNRVFWKR